MAQLQQDVRTQAFFADMVENFVLSTVHAHVFDTVKGFHEAEDAKLAEQLQRAAGSEVATLRALGIRPELRTSESALETAIATFAALDTHTTPLDKARCVQRTLAQIADGLSMQVHGPVQRSKHDALTTDDVIPLLAFVVIHATAAHGALMTNLVYARDFLLSDQTTSQLGFALVTLQAVLEFIERGGLAPRATTPLTPTSSKQAAHAPARRGSRFNRFPTATAAEHGASTGTSAREELFARPSAGSGVLRPPTVIDPLAPRDPGARLGEFLSALQRVPDTVVTSAAVAPRARQGSG
eukprot:Unigene297_Nuclearia_a/m.1011 Unigene297_Nuclearia_a/g.1011  ORF Unigene297_Nuclearia_a/g.1011 Unigene297_Nuclearia_a/m.1011 type:complete len:297 (+) Unigene297_Nuclearia_a:424-1314(+)